jgi:hypothetical protein
MAETRKATAVEIKDVLRTRHGCHTGSREWVCIEEAFCGPQSAGGGIDLFAVGAWATAGAPGLSGAGKAHGEWGPVEMDERNGRTTRTPPEDDARWPLVAYEIKVSRADFAREVNGTSPGHRSSKSPKPPWPAKAMYALDRTHYFMFAVPKGLLTDDEIERRSRPEKGLWLPPEAGLIEIDKDPATGLLIDEVRVPAPRRIPRLLKRNEVAELLRYVIDPPSGKAMAA